MAIPPNDNDFAATFRSEAYDRAAIILVESLLHHLVERSVISTADAVEIVDVAAGTKRELAGTEAPMSPSLTKSLATFDAIRRSLLADTRGGTE